MLARVCWFPLWQMQDNKPSGSLDVLQDLPLKDFYVRILFSVTQLLCPIHTELSTGSSHVIKDIDGESMDGKEMVSYGMGTTETLSTMIVYQFRTRRYMTVILKLYIGHLMHVHRESNH
ncbi:hypothetical protein BS78_03G016900 [Paspalum vaginatum]|nr:hypothetical protein BS78_03G016900 [Paspalum vaginatum]